MSASRTPGTATAIASNRTRRSKCTAPRSDPISLSSEAMRRHAPVERAAAQPECLRGVTDVAVESREGFLDERALGFVERQLLQSLRTARAAIAQCQIGLAHHVAAGEKHCALDRVLELADVARPRMVHE